MNPVKWKEELVVRGRRVAAKAEEAADNLFRNSKKLA
jgi:hypothetical protein